MTLRSLSLAFLALTLLLLTGCMPPTVRPIRLQVADAKRTSPLRTVDDMVSLACFPAAWLLWGRDAEGRRLAVFPGRTTSPHIYPEGLTWEEALARVEAAGYLPLPAMAPVVALPPAQAWVVRAEQIDGTSLMLSVAMSDGAVSEGGEICLGRR